MTIPRTPTATDRGAAAVEFALVAPVLIALVLGIVSFGYAYHVQTVLGNAARDGVRVLALSDDADPASQARTTAISSAAPSVVITADQITVTPAAGCDADGAPENASVDITVADVSLLGGFLAVDLTGSGTMRCNG
ncbi:TadE/TadG family type IV pilus assembly protein [Isoptericola sediminis]|uniref:Pilus assembly protein n=1 Tax=Isoptericola sediminis TaxID=2733572 RepID=A0A849K5D9_9MICO|nr:TadE family protein [Isoptericola sediminis]NNU27249.1 pilus assembly protein [Isoptericola sediminis]